MRLDLKHALRHVLCLPNPSALAGARWGEASVDTKHALRHVSCLTNPSALRPQEVGGNEFSELLETSFPFAPGFKHAGAGSAPVEGLIGPP